LEPFSFIVTLLIFAVIEGVQRAFELAEPFGYQMKVYRGGFYRDVAQKMLDGIEIGSLVQQVGGKAVTKGMYSRAFGQSGFFCDGKGLIDCPITHMPFRVLAGEEPLVRPICLPVFPLK
jgi:hypothetical protein